MAVNPVQLNTQNQPSQNKKAYKPYLEAEGTINTENNVKPLPPKGHLVDDNLVTGTKYFFKDIGYDLKAVKDGYKGDANDHQAGRLNDVGLRLGGIGIATYLATRTTNPKARLMEYIGLATFLTAMAVYPKIAINAPARILHGYDIDKEYIDDQGRKKSVQQDSNYVPYDMYIGEMKDEDIDLIGDTMGIPRDIKNRHDIIREQMRKIATQNNTLWMLTAGFATPVLTALACCGLENYVVAPAVAKSKNSSANKQIANLLNKTKNMSGAVDSAKDSFMSKNIENILKSYKGDILPQEEFENIANIITEGLESNTSQAIKVDLSQILKPKGAISTDELLLSAEQAIKGRNSEAVKKALIPTREEFERILNSIGDGVESKPAFKDALRNLLDSKINVADEAAKQILEYNKEEIIDVLSSKFEIIKTPAISDTSIEKVKNFAKIISEFKENKIALNKCAATKFEYAPDTMLARSSAKFERTLLKELGVPFKELKKMRDSEEYAKEVLDKKLKEVCSDEAKFSKFINKLGKVMSETEVVLHGSNAEGSNILNLVNSIEYNHNNTAKRLAGLDREGFGTTIKTLIGEAPEATQIAYNTREDIFKLLDLITPAVGDNKDVLEHIKVNSKGVGSSKYLDISRIFERYQGNNNSYSRLIHTADMYKRMLNSEEFAGTLSSKNSEYLKEVLDVAKETMISGTPDSHFSKLNTINAPEFYKDVMNTIYGQSVESGTSTLQKGKLSQAAKEALSDVNSAEKGNVLDRIQYYISKCKNIIANNQKDFTKPEHVLNVAEAGSYTPVAKTEKAISNLIGQNPVRMIQDAAGRKYSTGKWARIMGGIAAGVLGVTMIAQFGFGKIKNPHNIQKAGQNEKH